MARHTYTGKLTSLRINRFIGYGPPSDHVKVHVVAQLDSPSDKRMAFPLTEDSELPVHQAWVDLLREAYTNNHTVILESDFETKDGNNGILRTVTLSN